MIPAREGLQRLREGNERFVSDSRSSEAILTHSRRRDLGFLGKPGVETRAERDVAAFVSQPPQ